MKPLLDRARRLEEAREAYRRHDWRMAHAALSVLHEQAPGLDVGDLTILADCAWWLGRVAENLRLSEEVHRRLVSGGDLEAAAVGAIDMGFVAMMRGDLAMGSGWMGRARRLLEGRPPGLGQGLLRYVDANVHLEEGRIDEALAGAHELRELGETLEAPTLTALGLLVEGLAQVRQGELTSGFAALDEAMLSVVASGVRSDWAGTIYCHTILLCHQLADLRRAREWQRATEEWCSQFSDAVMYRGICRLHRAQLLQVQGAWGEAEREVELVCADLAGVNVDVVAEGEYQRGEIHRAWGDPRGARTAYERARQLGREPEPGWSLLLLLEGHVDEAWASVNACLARSSGDPFKRVRLLRAHVEIALAHGRVDAAERSAAELEEMADTYPSPGFITWSRHARGAVLLAEDRGEEALRQLQLACRGYESLGATYEMARVQSLLAEAFARVGDHDLSGAARREAEGTLRRLGTAGACERLPAGLSAREAEVLRYVARGASNRDVAAALSISDKTVGRHLANVFTKLGVSSRTAAAAWAHEHGLTASFAPSGGTRDA